MIDPLKSPTERFSMCFWKSPNFQKAFSLLKRWVFFSWSIIHLHTLEFIPIPWGNGIPLRALRMNSIEVLDLLGVPSHRFLVGENRCFADGFMLIKVVFEGCFKFVIWGNCSLCIVYVVSAMSILNHYPTRICFICQSVLVLNPSLDVYYLFFS